MSLIGYEPNSQPTALPRPVLNEERISGVNFSNSRPKPRSCGPQGAQHTGQPNRGSRDQRTVPRDTGNRVCPIIPSPCPGTRAPTARDPLPLGTVLDDRASPCPTHRITAPRHGRACLPAPMTRGQGHGARNLIRLSHGANYTHHVTPVPWHGPVYFRSVHYPHWWCPLIRVAISDQFSSLAHQTRDWPYTFLDRALSSISAAAIALASAPLNALADSSVSSTAARAPGP